MSHATDEQVSQDCWDALVMLAQSDDWDVIAERVDMPDWLVSVSRGSLD